MSSHAAEVAQQLLDRGKYQIPIDVHQVASDLGLVVVEQDLEDQVSGLLVVKGKTGTIGVNANHHINRQRFTIAHECGHYLLHRDDTRVFIDAVPVFFRADAPVGASSSQEIDANNFAAALLMPKLKLQELLREQPVDAFDDVALRRLANLFGVSTQALTIRLTRLNLISL